jgi:integral membrane protein
LRYCEKLYKLLYVGKLLLGDGELFKAPLNLVRSLGIIEGISFLLLLFIAMPLKYIFELPLAVSIVGALHGGLFVLYIVAVLYLMFAVRWSLLKTFIAMLVSVIPFGPFLFDKYLYNK